ncbi:MAG: S4 domain-containing protein [Acidobacteriota bacterium]
MGEERLQKIIARSGLCSRRDADEMIREGRVTVNGRVAELGAKADPTTAHIKVDGKRIKAPEALRYLLLYKPREVMTTCDDPEERTTVIDLIKAAVHERLYPVG